MAVNVLLSLRAAPHKILRERPKALMDKWQKILGVSHGGKHRLVREQIKYLSNISTSVGIAQCGRLDTHQAANRPNLDGVRPRMPEQHLGGADLSRRTDKCVHADILCAYG